MDEEVTHPTSDKSILDLLQEDFKSITEIKDVHIPIPGWEKTGLSIKYRLPEGGQELDSVARKVIASTSKNDRFGRGLAILMDTIIKLSEGLYVRPPGMEVFIELDPSETGGPLQLADGEELSAIFKWEPTPSSAREVLKKLFGNNDFAIINHGEKLQKWIVDTKADLNTEVWELGEAL